MRETARPVENPPTSEADLGRFFKALADDTRRAILGLLERRERNVSEIVRRFNLTQPTISRHLQVLREARLVRCERRGQHMIYRLDPDALALGASVFFGRFRRCRRAGLGPGLGSLPQPAELGQPADLKPVEGNRTHRRFRFDG